MRFEARAAILLEQRKHSALADTACADLRLHVMLHDIETDVGEDQVPYILAQSALLIDLDWRNSQRLLPDLDRVGIVAPGNRTPDIRLVTLYRGPRNQFVFEE